MNAVDQSTNNQHRASNSQHSPSNNPNYHSHSANNSAHETEPSYTTRSLTSRLVSRAVLIRRSIWHSVVDLTSSHSYSHASAIAFNALLSFFPFIILLLVVCRKFLNWQDGHQMILSLLKDDYLPVEGEYIARNLKLVAANAKTAIFSLGALIFTSSGVFGPIELALNRAWRITEERKAWQSIPLALGLVIVCGLLALASLFIASSTQNIVHYLLGDTANHYIIAFLVTMLIKTMLLPLSIAVFFIIYYFLPNRRVPFGRVLSAAIFIAILWELAKYIFGWCLPLMNFASVYGPFYITVTLIMWAFISSLLLLLGANLSAQWPD